MRQIVNLVCVSALCLGHGHGLSVPLNERKVRDKLKVFEKPQPPSVLERITASDAVRRNRIIRTFHQKSSASQSKSNSDFDIESRSSVFLPTPSTRRVHEGFGTAGVSADNQNLQTVTQIITDAEHLFEADDVKLNTDDNDTYYFGDDINLTNDIPRRKSSSAPKIFVTPFPSAPETGGDTHSGSPQTLQSLYQSDLNNKTFKLSLNFPSPTTNYFYKSDLYNQTLDELFSPPTVAPDTSETNQYPLTLIVKQSEGREEGLDINDHIANDILTPTFRDDLNNDQSHVERYIHSGTPQSHDIKHSLSDVVTFLLMI